MQAVGYEVRNVGWDVNCRYEIKLLDEWVPTTREEIAQLQHRGHLIHWNKVVNR